MEKYDLITFSLARILEVADCNSPHFTSLHWCPIQGDERSIEA